MAPEVLTKQKYGSKADIWSFGCLMFNMLTATFPFNSDNQNGLRDVQMEELKKNQNNGKFKLPHGLKLTLDCIDFLKSCLKFDSSQRMCWNELLNHRWFQNSTTHVVSCLNDSIVLDCRQSIDMLALELAKCNRKWAEA